MPSTARATNTEHAKQRFIGTSLPLSESLRVPVMEHGVGAAAGEPKLPTGSGRLPPDGALCCRHPAGPLPLPLGPTLGIMTRFAGCCQLSIISIDLCQKL